MLGFVRRKEFNALQLEVDSQRKQIEALLVWATQVSSQLAGGPPAPAAPNLGGGPPAPAPHK